MRIWQWRIRASRIKTLPKVGILHSMFPQVCQVGDFDTRNDWQNAFGVIRDPVWPLSDSGWNPCPSSKCEITTFLWRMPHFRQLFFMFYNISAVWRHSPSSFDANLSLCSATWRQEYSFFMADPHCCRHTSSKNAKDVRLLCSTSLYIRYRQTPFSLNLKNTSPHVRMRICGRTTVCPQLYAAG